MTGDFVPAVCPHDCPSACALEVERLEPTEIGRVRGAVDNPYTDGVLCAKVNRYRERTHHPDRLTEPLKRVGPKGEGAFEPISWDVALDTVAAAFQKASETQGPESVWPYFYAGTMGIIQRKGILRLRRLMGYSQMARTICASVSGAGLNAGLGIGKGIDGLEMAECDLAVFWGTNPVSTQIQAMQLALAAKKERGAPLVTVDPYRTRTAALSDMHLMPRPGTDGALACATMHVLFRDGLADREYLERMTDFPADLERHLESRSPEWAAAITGLEATEIEAFAQLYGRTKKSFLRLGNGFTRQRNGAANLHAVTCLPAITGAWQHKGGGLLMSSGAAFSLNVDRVEGLDQPDKPARILDMSRIGDVLLGDTEALCGGPPVTAMLMQNVNPAAVAPELDKVRAGLAREDLFLCVHEQFLTDTAKMADIVLPATSFVEHDDIYTSYGHCYLQASRQIIEPVGESRSNHRVIGGLLSRLGADHPSNAMSAEDLADLVLKDSGQQNGLDGVTKDRWVDCRESFEDGHFLNGFGHPDGKFRFAPKWDEIGPDHAAMPRLPDHMDVLEKTDDSHPFRLVTAPARNFLNSSFSETETSRKAEKRPTLLIHPEDCAVLSLEEGSRVRLSNKRGEVTLHAKPFDGLQQGVVVVESIWPASAFEDGRGINTLVGSDPVPPAGGAAFHDIAIKVEKLA
ncbi:molybdopterin-dependent oxidoreductase [Magnetospira sp. QH-2]|uniref:molybdopterin-containing oxidoreductase family protein n=1 Tax=Magnetospira sp. (strain QH-2) TaxID=1288970 RepID=UPI0005FA6D6F|nr:molybdopterin oxidoreductase family protein [Magnetospira sp. QH-2]